MKNILSCIVLVGVLPSVGCGGPQKRFDEEHPTEYLNSREGKKLVYPEGVDVPERLSIYDIPPLSSETVTQDYDINELVRPPDLLGRGIIHQNEDKTAVVARSDYEAPSKIYAGVGIGSAEFKDQYEGVSYNDTPGVWQIYTGFRLNDYLAGELVYKRLDDIESGEIPGSGFDRLNISSEFESIGIRARVSMPLSDWFGWKNEFSVFASVGQFDSEVRREVLVLDSLETDLSSDEDSGRAIGWGILYRIGEFGLRGYFESLEVNNVGEVLDAGIAIEFGF